VAVKQHLRSHAVSFEEIDVSTDMQKAKAMVEQSGQYGVPVVDIDGVIVVGFDRPRIDALLGIA
jgi:glutaredoxin